MATISGREVVYCNEPVRFKSGKDEVGDVMKDWYSVKNIETIPTPALLVYPERIGENLKRLISMVGDVAKLRPHVKTHKMTNVVHMKLDAGISKFKASTIAEVEMTADAGGKDILFAYQPVGPNIGRLIKLIQRFPAVRISALVDNPDSLTQIANAAVEAGVKVELFIDLNVGMNRTGIVLGEEADQLYRLICSTESIKAGGFHAYDGHLHIADYSVIKEKAEQTFANVVAMRERMESEGLQVPTIVASGTPTSKILAKYDHVEVGTGTTVLWDSGQPKDSPYLDFLNAAVLVSRVVSRPAPNRICLDLGNKAVASEMPQPRVQWFGVDHSTVVLHNEEHMVLELDNAEDYPVGAVVYGLPHHICPTVALYNQVWCIQNGSAVDTWPVVARARCLTI